MNLNINLDELKEKKELVSVVLLGGAAILVVLTCITITKFFLLSTKTENIILNAVTQSKRPQQDVEKVLAETQALAENLRMNNLFAPPVIQTQTERPAVVAVNPVTEVTAILGNLVCINENWYSIGDTIPGTGGSARISAIGLDFVTVEFNGAKQNLYPIQASTRASDISATNPMASMMGGGISINNGNITISSSAANDILSRLTQGGGMMGGMMGGGRGGRGGGMGGGGMGGGGRGGRGGGGGGGGFGGF